MIAAAAILRRWGIDYSTCMYVGGIDIDSTAAYMSYIQWTLLGIPATVYVGNTLSMEMRECWHTPWYWMGTMPWRVRRWRKGDNSIIGDAPTFAQDADEEELLPMVNVEEEEVLPEWAPTASAFDCVVKAKKLIASIAKDDEEALPEWAP